jgi:hypothetical protein
VEMNEAAVPNTPPPLTVLGRTRPAERHMNRLSGEPPHSRGVHRLLQFFRYRFGLRKQQQIVAATRL